MSAQVAIAPAVPAQKTRSAKVAPPAAAVVADPLQASALKDPLAEAAPVVAPVATPAQGVVPPLASGKEAAGAAPVAAVPAVAPVAKNVGKDGAAHA